MKYSKIKDGTWLRPKLDGFRMSCCDCGLVHTLTFKHTELGILLMRVSRNLRATAAVRRRKHDFRRSP